MDVPTKTYLDELSKCVQNTRWILVWQVILVQNTFFYYEARVMEFTTTKWRVRILLYEGYRYEINRRGRYKVYFGDAAT